MPTGGGKSLCYHLPALDRAAQAPERAGKSLYLFPTKALAQDQMHELVALAETAELSVRIHTFDGDTPAEIRRAVRESGDEIIFLHKIVLGGTDRSYGIHVARLAGVPHPVLARARVILADIEADEEDLSARILSSKEAQAPTAPPKVKAPKSPTQLGLFVAPPSEVEAALRELDLDSLAPIDALLQLRELKSKLDA